MTARRNQESSRISLFLHPKTRLEIFRFQKILCWNAIFRMEPFLSYRSSGRLFIISQSHLHSSLKRLLSTLNLSPHVTFHSFRRSRVSLAFASGISVQAIQVHGTWSSDAFWAYIDSGAWDATVPQFFCLFFNRL
jgi:hypothetical protein